ncbi:MAG: hypothetical protein V1769_04780 [Thermoplasmatota archaeon]
MKQKRMLKGAVIFLCFLLFSTNIMNVLASYERYHQEKNQLFESSIEQIRQHIRPHSIKNMIAKTIPSPTQIDLKDLFTSTIHTTCRGLEKTSEITFGLLNDLDVDGDETNGVNGKDIRVQYYILPYIEVEPHFILGARFTVIIQRIGEEIKENDFNITATLGNNILSVGYWSPDSTGNEIPTNIKISLLVFFNTADSTKGITISMDPTYSTELEDKKLVFFSTYYDEEKQTHHHNSFSFEPPTGTDITIASTKTMGELQYTINRETNDDTVFTMKLLKTYQSETKETIITFDRFPKTVSFSLKITPFSVEGGSVYYKSESMYDMDVLIQTNELGTCKYAIIKNTPRMLFAEWLPVKEQGWYHLEMDSDGTDIRILDSLQTPSVNLSIYGVTDVNMTALWNFTNPGDLKIIKDPSFHINLSFIMGVWEARLDAHPVAEDISISWLTDITGYLTYDTNWQTLNQMDLLIRGSDVGIRTVAESFKAEDFRLDWTVWPITEFNIDSAGEIDFLSLLIEVYIEGNWYKIWPWF